MALSPRTPTNKAYSTFKKLADPLFFGRLGIENRRSAFSAFREAVRDAEGKMTDRNGVISETADK